MWLLTRNKGGGAWALGIGLPVGFELRRGGDLAMKEDGWSSAAQQRRKRGGSCGWMCCWLGDEARQAMVLQCRMGVLGQGFNTKGSALVVSACGG